MYDLFASSDGLLPLGTIGYMRNLMPVHEPTPRGTK